MATHAQNIDNLQNAVYGEEVRTSMIELFNEDYGLVKKAVGIGTDITGSTSSITGYYEGNLYINNSTMDIWQMDGSGWTKVGNLKTISSIDTQESQADAGDNAITINFSDGTVKSFNVRNGSKGSTGVSVTGVVDNRDGTFCLTLSDGTRTGNVETIKGLKGDTGAQGPKGDTGDNGRGITSITSANSGKNHVLSANYTDGQSSIICTVRDGNDGAGTGDMLKATYDTADRGYVDFAEQLTDGTNSVTVTDVRNKADKATTLSGYGITNAYTKTEVDDLLDAVEPTWDNVDNKPFDGLDSTFFDTTTSGNNLTIKSGSLSKFELESDLQNDLQSIPSCDAWDGDISYKKGAICIYNNVVRRSLADNNQGNYPATSATDNTYWKASSLNGEFGAINTALTNLDGALPNIGISKVSLDDIDYPCYGYSSDVGGRPSGAGNGFFMIYKINDITLVEFYNPYSTKQLYVRWRNPKTKTNIMDWNVITGGTNGSFTDKNGKTITVINGLITSIT